MVASFQSQYGLRLSKDLSGMKWREFSYFIAGLGSDTPLGHIISIRAETDREALKSFTPEQRRIRNEWKARHVKQIPKEKSDQALCALQETFKSMFMEQPKVEEEKLE